MPVVDVTRTTTAATGRDGAQLTCPKCTRPLQVARNQYYGVGLAVHEWLHVCPGCPWFAFAPSSSAPAVVSGEQRHLPRWAALFQRYGRHRTAR